MRSRIGCRSRGACEFRIAQSLEIYDTAGRLVTTLVDDHTAAGPHSVTWNGTGMPSGVYYARLLVGNEEAQMHRLVLLK